MTRAARPFLRVLGRPAATHLGQSVSLPVKCTALLAYLIGQRTGSISRRRLAELLWPKSETRRALHSLSQAVYIIGRELGSDTVLTTPVDLRLGEIGSDLIDFRSALESRDWVGAAKVYGGSFLEDMDLPYCTDFEHWADRVRSEVARKAEAVLEELLAADHWAEAYELGSALRSRDPLNEDILRAIVRALYHLRRLTAIEALIQDTSPTLANELKDEYERLVQELKPGAHPYPGPFVGREDAMDWLMVRLERCKRGRSAVTLIDGEAGIGKTALADRFARLATIRGSKVLKAAAYQAEQNVPFGVVGQLLQGLSNRDISYLSEHPWMRVVAGAFPISGQEGSSTGSIIAEPIGHQRLLESLRRLFAHLGEERPLVLVIDDLDAADAASVSFLHFLIRRSENHPILVVGTMRIEKDFVGDPIRTWSLSDTLTLEGLSAAAVRDWISQSDHLGSHELEAELEILMERTGGNPLLLSILLSESDRKAWRSKDPPQTVVDFFRPRLEAASPAAKTFLRALSIIGEPSPVAVIGEIADLESLESDRAIQELSNNGLILMTGEMVALRHGLLGEVATSTLSNFEKQRLHGRVARVLSGRGQPSDAFVAISSDIAGNKADAYRAALRACDACDVLHALAEKEFFLKLALSNAPAYQDAGRVRIQLADLYLKQKRPKEGLTILGQAESADLPPDLRTSLEAARLRILTETTGDIHTLHELWARAKALEAYLDELTIADTYSQMASVAHDLGADALTLEISERVLAEISELPLTLDVARRLLRPTAMVGMKRGYRVALERLRALPEPSQGHPVYASTYHEIKGALQIASGQLLEAESSLSEGLAIAERFALFDRYYAINNNLGVCLMEQGRFEEAEGLYGTALEYTSDEIEPTHHSIARDNLTILLYEMSDFDRSIKLGEQALARGEGLSRRELLSLHGILGLCNLELGNLSGCRQAERELNLLLQAQEPYGNDMSYVQMFLARMHASRMETDKALSLLTQAARTYDGLNRPAFIRVEIERSRLLLAAGIDCRGDIEGILEEIRGTGAVPLIERAEELRSRAERQFS